MYFSPSSPAEKVTEEQKPSEELIRSVDPSFDLDFVNTCSTMEIHLAYHVISVKVAKCRLLTMHNGFCCCVS